MNTHRVSDFIWNAVFVVSVAIITATLVGWLAGHAAVVIVSNT